jgi:hypothetical protein
MIGIGYALGSFQPLPGFESPVPAWMGWTTAALGFPIAIVGVVKLGREIRGQLDAWIHERDERDARKRALGIH